MHALPRRTGRPLSFDRDAALRQAMLTFWRHGYETTSVADLTAAMGISAPSLYTAFGDKRRLFLEAMRLYASDPADMERAIANARTAQEAAHDLMTAAATTYTGEGTPRGCLLASATATKAIQSTKFIRRKQAASKLYSLASTEKSANVQNYSVCIHCRCSHRFECCQTRSTPSKGTIG